MVGMIFPLQYNILKLYQFDIGKWFDNTFWPPYQTEARLQILGEQKPKIMDHGH